MKKIMKEDIFDSQNEMQPQSINWGQVGDNVVGTKVGQRSGVPTRFGKNTIYEVLVESGTFHTKDGVEVKLQSGDVWGIWGRGDIFDAQMNRMKIGQKFGLKFTESKESSKGNDAKIVKVYTTGAMNEEWLGAQELIGE
jgi:hypothetical protein